MSHHSKAQPAKASAVNATAIQDAGDARKQRRGQPSSLISPLALMALGLAGAATAGSPVPSTDQSGDATGVDQNGSDAVNAAAVAQADPLLTATSPDAVATTTDSPTVTLDVAQDTALDTPQVAEAVAVASLDPALAADLATTDAAPAADGATALTLKLDMPALPGTAAEAPQLVAAAPLEGSTSLPATAPAAAAVGATEFSAGQLVGVLAGLVAVGAAVSGSSESKDTTPPAAPTATLATDSGASATDGVTKVGTVTVGALETGGKWEYSTNAGTSWTTGTGSSFTLADGSYAANAVQVRQTDAAGNVSTTTGKIATAVMVDNVIAAVTASLSTDSGSSATDGITNATGLTLSTAAADVTRSYAVDGGAASASYVAPTVDGKHSVVITDTDTAGNSASTTLAFTLDKTIAAPTVALSTDSGSSATDGISNLAGLSLGAAAADVTRSYKVDGGAASASYVAPTTNGAHTVQVTDTDTAGNSASTSLGFTLDTVGASASISAPTATTPLGATAKLTITFDGKVAGFDATDLVDAKGGKFGNLATADGGTTWTVDFTPNPDRLGPASIAVTGAYTDLAGNAGTASSAVAVKYFAYATAADGDIRGAKIYADVDRSGSVTAADVLVGTTGVDGSVSVALDAGQDAYALLATGGTDISTGLAFTGLMRAPAGSTMITPLTTLVQSLLDADTSTGSAAAKLAAAQSKVLAALSLPANIDLTSYDALDIAVASTTSTAAEKADAARVQSKAIVVANLLAAGSAALQGSAATGQTVTSAQAGAAVLSALSAQIASAGATPVDLTSTKTMMDLLVSATINDNKLFSALNPALLTQNIGVASSNLSVANQAVTDAMKLAADNASTSNQFLASLTDAVKVQTVAQGSVSTALASGTAVALDATALKTQTQAVTSVNLTSTQAGVADKTAPAAPALVGKDTGTSATDGITNVGAINVTGLETGGKWEYSSNAGATWVKGTGTSFTLAEGAYAANAVQVRQTDAAGNVSVAGKSAAAITVDSSAAAPTLALASDTGASAADGITKVGTVNVTGLEAGATWEYNANGTWVAGTGGSFTLADGAYASVQVRQTDVAGNLSAASKAAAITVDNTIAKPTMALAGDSGLTLSAAAADVTRSYSVDGGAASASYVAPQLNGAHTVVVTDLDTAGNSASASLSFTLDRKFVGPTLTLTDNGVSATDGITNAAGLTISTPLAGFTRSIAVDGKTVSSYAAPTTDGVHTVKVTDTDAAGNVASSSLSFTLDTVVPTATVVAPSVPNSAGNAVFAFNFSEAVTGFERTDIAVVNGTAGEITTIDSSHYTTVITTTGTAPVNLTINVGAGAATDIAGNSSASAAAQILQSVFFGSSGDDKVTLGTAQETIFLGSGSDTIAIAGVNPLKAGVNVADTAYGFGTGDHLDFRALLSGYTSLGVADTGAGFVEIKNLLATYDATTKLTDATFDITFDAASIGSSSITGAVIDLKYDYALATDSVITSPKYGTKDVWTNITSNLSASDGAVSSINGKIAFPANTAGGNNPIITPANVASGKVLTVELFLNGDVSGTSAKPFTVGLESVAAGGATSILTANGVSNNVDVGITKSVGSTGVIGNTGTLEIVTDTGKLGTVADNQLHLVTTYDKASDLTHLMIQYDTNAAKGTTSLSSVVAMDFGGDVTNLIPASLIFTGP